jgi:putative membrane protein
MFSSAYGTKTEHSSEKNPCTALSGQNDLTKFAFMNIFQDDSGNNFKDADKDLHMTDSILASIAGLPAFLSFFALAILLVLLFCRFYSWVTPHDEFALIRANNPAAAIAFVGALIGFALPLASAIEHSVSLADCAIWGALALLVQIATFVAVRLTVRHLPQRISDGEIASGIFAAGCSIAVGLVNAASMTF